MAYPISPISYFLGVATFAIISLATFAAYKHTRDLGGVVGKSYFYGFLGTASFFLFGLSTMVLNFFEPFRTGLVGRRGWILMPLAILTGFFWFLSFRELEKVSGLLKKSPGK